MADKYQLITTMWYKTRDEEDQINSNYVYLQGKDPENANSGYFTTSLTTGPNNPLGAFECLGNEFSLAINFVNVDPNNPKSCITEQAYIRSYSYSVPNGKLSTEGFYYEEKNTPLGSSKKDYVYNVSSGSGIFEDAKIINVTEDRDGSLFGQKYVHRVEVYKLKSKQNEETPPDFSGIWEWKAYLYGNLNGKKIPLDKPLKLMQTYEIKQNGRFIENISTEFSAGPKRPPLPGVLEPTYNENLKFNGWKLNIADTTFDNGSWGAFVTIMENNVAMEFKGTYKESGFQEGNPIQSPLVGYATANRILTKKNND